MEGQENEERLEGSVFKGKTKHESDEREKLSDISIVISVDIR